MKAHISFFLLGFSSFLSLINPLAVAPMFATMTLDQSSRQKTRTALRASVTAAVTLILFVLLGELIFRFFGLTVHGFRIAGGILFFGMGYSMLHAQDPPVKTSEAEQEAAQQKADVAITPLAIPMLCGPGALSNAMILSRDASSWFQQGVLIFSILVVSLLIYLTLVGADRIVKWLGPTGINVVRRIMGLIIMVIAVEFVVAGARPIVQSMLTVSRTAGG